MATLFNRARRQTLFQLESFDPKTAGKRWNISRDEAGRLFCNCPSFLFGKVRDKDGARGCKHTQTIRLAFELAKLPEIIAAAAGAFVPDTGTGEPVRRIYFDEAE